MAAHQASAGGRHPPTPPPPNPPPPYQQQTSPHQAYAQQQPQQQHQSQHQQHQSQQQQQQAAGSSKGAVEVRCMLSASLQSPTVFRTTLTQIQMKSFLKLHKPGCVYIKKASDFSAQLSHFLHMPASDWGMIAHVCCRQSQLSRACTLLVLEQVHVRGSHLSPLPPL